MKEQDGAQRTDNKAFSVFVPEKYVYQGKDGGRRMTDHEALELALHDMRKGRPAVIEEVVFTRL